MTVLTKQAMYDVVRGVGAEPDVDQAMVTGAKAESDWNPAAVGDEGHSVGLFQMHDQGLGAGMTVAERADPVISSTAMLPPYRAGMAQAAAEGYTGQEQVVRACCLAEKPYDYGNMNSDAANHYRAAYPASLPPVEAAPAELGGLVYDADYPAELQAANWNCACCSAAWALQSLGFPVTESEITSAMVAAGLVTAELGLLDGSGAALAAWLQDTYSVSVERAYPAAWEKDLNPWVGVGPILLGGRKWCHWTGVRKGDADGLVLANPAPNWQGVGQHMSLAEWNAWGPFTALWVDPSYGGLTLEEPMTDEARAYVQATAKDEILRNLDIVLALPNLPREVRDPLEFGARPAAATLAEGRF